MNMEDFLKDIAPLIIELDKSHGAMAVDLVSEIKKRYDNHIREISRENETFIAVFCKDQRDFEELNPSPRRMFQRVKNASGLVGLKFKGIVKMYDWYKDKDTLDAYYRLEERQPELFK